MIYVSRIMYSEMEGSVAASIYRGGFRDETWCWKSVGRSVLTSGVRESEVRRAAAGAGVGAARAGSGERGARRRDGGVTSQARWARLQAARAGGERGAQRRQPHHEQAEHAEHAAPCYNIR